jgi:hypothetical protein
MYTGTMLSIVTTPEGYGLQMQHVQPMIYLDHWAFRLFSSDAALRSRFTRALQARGGTLAISWLNLGEYASVSVVESRRAAEALVASVLPAVFCIDVDLAAVDNREETGHPLPHADEAVALVFLKARGPSFEFTTTGLFEPLFDAGLAQTKDRLAAITQGRLEFLRQEYHRDPKLAQAVKHAEHPDALAHTTRTRAVVRTLAATFFPDLRRPITHNDAIDFLHAAIPINYCDIVLLDGGMRDLVERARRRFENTGIKLATVFSGQEGVSNFLDDLEK